MQLASKPGNFRFIHYFLIKKQILVLGTKRSKPGKSMDIRYFFIKVTKAREARILQLFALKSKFYFLETEAPRNSLKQSKKNLRLVIKIFSDLEKYNKYNKKSFQKSKWLSFWKTAGAILPFPGQEEERNSCIKQRFLQIKMITTD